MCCLGFRDVLTTLLSDAASPPAGPRRSARWGVAPGHAPGRRHGWHGPPDDDARLTQLQQAAPYAIHQSIRGNALRTAFEGLLHERLTGETLGDRCRDQRIDGRERGCWNTAR